MAQERTCASEHRVAVCFPVTRLLQILLYVHLLRGLDDFVRGALLPREELAAHLHHGGSILVFELAAALDEGVPEEEEEAEEGPDLSLFWFTHAVSSDTNEYSQPVGAVRRPLQSFPSLVELQKLVGWDLCKRSFTWTQEKNVHCLYYLAYASLVVLIIPLLGAAVVVATRCHAFLFRGLFGDERLPNVAISNSKIPKDQLDGDKRERDFH